MATSSAVVGLTDRKQPSATPDGSAVEAWPCSCSGEAPGKTRSLDRLGRPVSPLNAVNPRRTRGAGSSSYGEPRSTARWTVRQMAQRRSQW